MDGLNRASAAPAVITLAGKEYRLAPITLQDFGTTETYLLQRKPNVLDQAAEAANLIIEKADQRAAELVDKKPDDEAVLAQAAVIRQRANDTANKMMDRAFAEARKVNHVTTEETMAWIDSAEGAAFTIWLGIEKLQPGALSLKELTTIVNDMAPDDFRDLIRKRDQASGLDLVGN